MTNKASLDRLDQYREWKRSGVGTSAPSLAGVDLRGKGGSGIYLARVNLTGVDLSGAKLHGAKLRGANLTGAGLTGARLRGADLRWTKLDTADLREADLREADLREADLREADLCGADLYEADLTGADLCGANLPTGFSVASAHIGGPRHRIATLTHQAGEWLNIRQGCILAESRDDYLEQFESERGDGWTPDEIERCIQLVRGLIETVTGAES